MIDPTAFELTTEQQFEYELMERTVHKLNTEELRAIALKSAKLIMLKDNTIKSLTKKVLCNER